MKVSPDSTRIGWIGTGVMGRSMCGHLLDAGYEVTIKDKDEKLSIVPYHAIVRVYF